MLVLSRKRNEEIVISTPDGSTRISVMVVDVRGDKVRLGIQAPREFSVHRGEVQIAIDRENAAGGKLR